MGTMNRSAVRVVVAWGILALLLHGNVLATTAVAVDTQFLTERSTAVVLATVVSQESRWNDDHAKVYTFTVLDVRDDYKGKIRGKKVTVKQLGGTVDGIVCRVPGQPAFRKGEKVLLFLEPMEKERDRFRVVGMAQGKYSVREDGTAVRDLKELDLVGAARDRVRHESPVQLGTLIEEVRSIVSKQSRQAGTTGEGDVR
jgi:hypothetical protein